MPHRKLQRAVERVRTKRERREAKKRKQRAMEAAERGRRRRRLERNEPRGAREHVQATARQAKELGREVAETARSVAGRSGGRSGGRSKQSGSGSQSRPQLLTSLPGVGETTAERLRQRGFTQPSDIKQASVADLSAVPGIGHQKAKKLIRAAGGTVRERREGDGGGTRRDTTGQRDAGGIPDFSTDIPSFDDLGGDFGDDEALGDLDDLGFDDL